MPRSDWTSNEGATPGVTWSLASKLSLTPGVASSWASKLRVTPSEDVAGMGQDARLRIKHAVRGAGEAGLTLKAVSASGALADLRTNRAAESSAGAVSRLNDAHGSCEKPLSSFERPMT